MRDRHPKGLQVPLPTVVEYVTQVASALQYAHDQRVVHRDVKPENMLVRADGIILLSDFGIATTAHSTHSLNVNQGIGGTVPYMAPEQLEGKPRTKSDQYALAVVIYEWLAGCCPFQGTAVEIAMQHTLKAPPPLVTQVPGIPQEVEDVLLSALAKIPKDRFASIQTFLSAFQQASSPTTFYRPTLSVPGELSPSPVTPQPSATLPPVGDPLSVLPSSVEPTTKTTNPKPDPPTGKRRALPTSGFVSQTPSPKLPIREHPALPRRRRGHSKGQATLVLLIVVLLMAISVGSYACL